MGNSHYQFMSKNGTQYVVELGWNGRTTYVSAVRRKEIPSYLSQVVDHILIDHVSQDMFCIQVKDETLQVREIDTTILNATEIELTPEQIRNWHKDRL